MSKPFKMTSPFNLRNFGVGDYISPVKEEESSNNKEKEEENKEEKKEEGKTVGVGGLLAAMASKGIEKAYGVESQVGDIKGVRMPTWKKNKEVAAEEENEEIKTILDPESNNDGEPTEMSFSNKEEGDKFRQWINDTYPEYAKEIDLDKSGSHTNSYIKKAWEKYGSEYSGSAAKMLSPLKARKNMRTAGRGGKHQRRATKTARRRGGFSKSKGKRGAGGRNVAGYNVQTRFEPRETNPTGGIDNLKLGDSGGMSKPYSYNKQGGIVINNNVYGGDGKQSQTQTQTQTQNQNMEWVPPVYGEKTISGRLPTYRESWDMNRRNVQSKYDNFEDYKKAAIAWNKKHGPSDWAKDQAKSRKERYLISEGYWRPSGGSSSQTQTQTQTQST